MTQPTLSRIACDQEYSIYKTFPVIRKIAYRKLKPLKTQFVEDILQTVFIKLWRWGRKGNGRDLTDEEWSKLANKVTHNEIRRFYKRETRNTNTLCALDDPANRYLVNPPEESLFIKIEGNTSVEVRSILLIVWHNLLLYTPLEKYSYLLQSQDIPRLLISHGCCRSFELAEILGLTTAEFLGLIGSLPLSDKDIASFMGKKLALEMTPKQILDARYRVRLRLQRALAGTKGNNGQASFGRTTSPDVKVASKRRRTD